jgi:hypothetical protein
MKIPNPFLLLGALLAFAPLLHAQLLANDPFLTGGTGYSPGVTVVGQNPTVPGFSGAWVAQFDGTNVVSASSLAYSAPGYAAPSGGSLSITAAARIGRLFDVTNPFNSNGTVYLSFLMQVSDSSVYKAFELNSGGDDGTRAFQLGVASTGDFPNSTNFGFRINNNASLSGSLGAYDSGVHLFVIRFDLTSAALGDSVTAWMDPSISSTGDPSGGLTISGFDLSSVDRFYLSSFGGAGAGTNYDEIRMGGTFQDVTTGAVPEPTTIACLIGGLCFVTIFARKKRQQATAA